MYGLKLKVVLKWRDIILEIYKWFHWYPVLKCRELLNRGVLNHRDHCIYIYVTFHTFTGSLGGGGATGDAAAAAAAVIFCSRSRRATRSWVWCILEGTDAWKHTNTLNICDIYVGVRAMKIIQRLSRVWRHQGLSPRITLIIRIKGYLYHCCW